MSSIRTAPFAGVVEAGLDRHHLPGTELAVQAADPRRLVDVQAHAVARPVEEALVPAVDHPGGVSTGLERPVDLGVDGGARRPVADELDPPQLAGEVSGRPRWSTSSPRTTLSRSISRAAARAASVYRCASSMAATSTTVFRARSGRKGLGRGVTAIPRSRSRSASSSGKSPGTSTAFAP
jgi:hypothetical protein